ncbi:MAG: hypothetical protein PHG85_00970 [Candidatus Altiarchaeota archaeon]|nr:hypothetical protein [Candidatus Altiarchaeota archaeon]
MLGKPEWFQRRKYGGWGLTPKTWQGWLYILVIIAPLFVLQMLGANGETIFAANLAWILVFGTDMLDIMRKLKKDERETQIEAMAERNSAWAMVAIIAIGVGYQAASSAASQTLQVDPFLIAALIAGALVKAASNIHLERKM